MGQLKVGVMIESFRLGVKKGIQKAAQLGADGFQIYVTKGEMAPWNLSQTGRRDFMHLVKSQGLVVSALCGDFGGGGFVRKEGLDERVDKTRQVLDLSRDLGVPVVTTHIGVVPEDEAAPELTMMREALNDLGDYASKVGSVFASETGPESGKALARFLRTLSTDTVRVNFDPANLVMNGFDEIQGVHDLADFIVHTHAKDGVRTAEGKHREVPLGEGDVRWEEYLGAMAEIGYEGFFTIEREAGDDPVKDVTDAIAFLRKF
ncbi:MAG TPA: sugar phosphate isomerase/epimerase family protein [Planctomycetota bacterium]|nr:sugar phosphate isomerase/epimerase family protein [Planctomycetota bacterium]